MSDVCKEMEHLGKGIGNTNRYHILEVLMKKPCTVGDIAKTLKLPQPTVSQGLKVLKGANLVVDERIGKEVRYSINVSYMTGLLHRLTKGVQKTKPKK